MLRSAKDLLGLKISASDGEVGSVDEFYFDDQAWTIRYVVVNTGNWLAGRRVLISPVAVAQPDWEERRLPVLLTTEQIRNSPDIETDRPVSRQEEIAMHEYYGWPAYWNAGTLYVPPPLTAGMPAAAPDEAEEPKGDPHLRSLKEVLGYHIKASDGEIGHAEDLLIDDQTWIAAYLVIDTRNWLPGKRVLLAPRWIEGVSWAEKRIHVDLPKTSIQNSPEYDPSVPVTRDYEVRLHEYYGRPGYW